MSKMFSPKTTMLGVKKHRMTNPVTGVEEIITEKPDAIEHVAHFVNGAKKAKFLSGKMLDSEARLALTKVPVYRGMDARTLHQLKQNFKYAAKLASPEWQAGRAARAAA